MMVMKRYNPTEIEPKWQQQWAESELYRAIDFADKPKYVMLTEFPYPSGDGLHLGHTREYTLGDIMARYKRMQGYNVLYPMGYDSFGLPTENYAIKHKIKPQDATAKNIANFKKQFDKLGFSIDWGRSFSTTDPDYYKWTQWLFLQFFKAGLAYQEEVAINWCPKCKTGLANEEVVNGRHERCDTLVEKKLLNQWLLKITEYADRLIDGLQNVDYPSRIADQQINWIGRSQGAEIEFRISNFEFRDSLKFTPELTKMILDGEMTSTIRLEAKNLQVGDTAEFLTRDGDRVAQFGAAEITKVRQLKLRDIPNDLEGHERLNDNDHKLATYRGYYGDDVSLDTEFTIYDFRFIPNSKFENLNSIRVFTTRPDTLFGATFMAIAPEHKLAKSLATDETRAKVEQYIQAATRKSEIERQSETKEKTGVFSGSYAINPVNGEKVPIWIADYILAGYGTGAIMAVPAHDERDFAFAKKYNLPIVEVVKPVSDSEKPFVGEGIMTNSGQFNDMPSSEAREKIVELLERDGKGRSKVTYKLRDWIFSRQHYWGEPIPIIHCDEHGAVPVPDDQLPVTLPEVEYYEPTDTGESPLAAIADWVDTTCPTCGKPAKRETDTMPNWAGSSWYYLRYYDAHNDKAFADRKKLEYWGMVDMYLGGMEHTTLHLLYSRFWHQFFYDQGLVPTPEPYKARRGQGIILAADGSKMSKSKGNVINPNEVIDSGYGADALRVAIAFIAPYDMTTPWSPEGVAGTYRFLNRVWTLVHDHVDVSDDAKNPAVVSATHRTIKKVSRDLEHMQFNTAVSALMELVNLLFKEKENGGCGGEDWRFALETLVKLLAPIAPHVAEELWHVLGNEASVHTSDWPSWDESLTVGDTMTIVVQVNGKLRATLELSTDTSEEDIKSQALSTENVVKFLDGKEPFKVIYVPKKLVNVVVK